MSSPTGKSPAEVVSEVSSKIRRPVRIGAHEKVLSAAVTDQRVMLLVEYWTVEETRNEWRVTGHGRAMLQWVPGADEMAQWEWAGRVALPDPDFVPETHLTRRDAATISSIRESQEWERLCYRPGTNRFPLDNFLRVIDGDTTKKMERHW